MRSLGLPCSLFLMVLASSLSFAACDGGVQTSSGGDPPEENPWVLTDASGVYITQISLYQGVKMVLMENGQPGPGTTPIAAGRDALMRLSLATDANYNGKPVVARLHVDGVEDPISSVGAVPGAPVETDLNTTLNIQIPGASIPAGFSFRVELLQPFAQSKGANPAAHYPAEGSAVTNAIAVGPALKIVLVPIQYNGDGSGRLPDTSEVMVKGYKDYFYAMYPAPQVEMTVREMLPYNQDVGAYGQGWEALLGYVSQVRQQDGAGFDVYYYGIFNPSNSLNQFCAGGCVAGLSNLTTSPGDSYGRASIGLGFSDQGGAFAFETAAHEVGHAHGRFHAPGCGAQGTDPQFPYSGGKTGVWGYNLLTQQFYDPATHADVMSYCVPIWVSDYTFTALMNRIKAVNMAKIIVPPEMKDLTYDRAYVDGDGELHWLPPVKMEMPPQGEPVEMEVEVGGEMVAVSGHYYPYSHLPGGTFVWPQAGAPSAAVSLPWDGSWKTLIQK
jgi:hypothetical protein